MSSLPSRISVALVLDLSKPEELWFTLETWLSRLRSLIESVISVARGDDPEIKDRLRKAAWERVGADHVVSNEASWVPDFTSIVGLGTVKISISDAA